MTTHDFPDAVKVQRFYLTLTGEARNWYATLEPIGIMWQELQNPFRQQYSKIGNTREQLFHAWRSFHYDENVETPDAYVLRIRQVEKLLGYGEPQVHISNKCGNTIYMAITSANVWYNILHTYLDYNIYQGNSNIKWHNICQNKHNYINIPNNIIRVYLY